MSNALVIPSNLPDLSNPESLHALQADAQDSAGGGDFVFLTFSGKSGRYTLGRDKDAIDEDLFVGEPRMATKGWACWKEKNVVARVGWSIFQEDRAVPFEDLEDHSPYTIEGDGWSPERTMTMIRMSDKKQVRFGVTSKSANNAFADYNGKVGEKVGANEAPYPIFSMDAEEFTSNGHTNYKPVFLYEAWVTEEAMMAWGAGDLTDAQLIAGKAPKQKLKAKAKKRKAA